MPFGSANEKIPVQVEQLKTSVRKTKMDRNASVVGLLLMIFGVILLFFYRDQTWLSLLGGSLLLVGVVLLALEASGGPERKVPGMLRQDHLATRGGSTEKF